MSAGRTRAKTLQQNQQDTDRSIGEARTTACSGVGGLDGGQAVLLHGLMQAAVPERKRSG